MNIVLYNILNTLLSMLVYTVKIRYIQYILHKTLSGWLSWPKPIGKLLVFNELLPNILLYNVLYNTLYTVLCNALFTVL